jgi:hypothetical protein
MIDIVTIFSLLICKLANDEDGLISEVICTGNIYTYNLSDVSKACFSAYKQLAGVQSMTFYGTYFSIFMAFSPTVVFHQSDCNALVMVNFLRIILKRGIKETMKALLCF